ncbi:MAG: hypothetical protein HY912_11070 [Desulfomonile tiedjei]|uniref:Rhodanese domain-containing protein n=1 Tax=Desulfomonile tiedjei TaxID=2358 RepID=A0A9D6V0W7_9BACT|nr:hypothetical protein [Desulfomonile tiedjei]
MSVILGFSALVAALEADGISRLAKEELRAMLESPELVVIDVRDSSDRESGDSKTRCAVGKHPSKVELSAKNHSPQKNLVNY